MKKLFILLFLLVSVCSFAQRQMENLGRGLVAVKVSGGVYVNWRITGQEWYGTTYNLYRDGTKLNETPFTGASNFTDTGGTLQSTYTVTAVKNAKESAHSKPAKVLANNYINIQLRDLGVSGYEPNDVTVADLDGDGEMEIILKRLYPNWTPQAKHFSYIEAYKLDGTFLWAINVGPNIISDVENNVAAFDLDGDGKAEVFMRTSEGTVFGDGTEIGDTDGDGIVNYRSYSWAGDDGDYPNHSTYLCKGPEFLSLIDGETGKELDRVDYIPRTFDGKTIEDIWNTDDPNKGKSDGGHRANKFFFGAPYLDGKKPSLFISRGIYTRIVMRTYDVVDKKLVFKWEFNTDDNPTYVGQGNHNYSIADVDGDGCDEIVYASMVVDHDGKGLYSTQLGHGDALHVGDLDPYRKGLELWACHENPPYGTSLRDAATGEILIRHYTSKDCPRAMAANVTNDFPGTEVWGGGKMFSATTREATPGITYGGPENYVLYWDGDLLQETFNYPDKGFSNSTGGGEGAVFKYKNGRAVEYFRTSGALTCNWTKGTPCMQVDLLGDWREEIILRSADNKSLRIYTTTDPTEHRIYTLLHDMQYRQAICWQMCGYNQPPHTSYFLGEAEGITLPPPPVMDNDKLVSGGDGIWSGLSWTKNDVSTSYSDGASVLLNAENGATITLSNAVSPELLTINSPGDYTLLGGSLAGTMRLNKQGLGTLTLSSELLYSGPTELWDGAAILTANIQNSPVWMNRFTELELRANLNKGLIQEYASILRIGKNDEKSSATIKDSLWLKQGAQVDLDLYDADFTADVLKINGDLVLTEGAVLNIIPHLSGAEIKTGEYLIAEVSGAIKGRLLDVTIRGLDRIACSLVFRDGKLYLAILDMRMPASVVWQGATNNGEWNLALTKNFLNNGEVDVFATGDQVVMNDEASGRVVQITSDVAPASWVIDAASNYTISGESGIVGEATFTKQGTGTVTMHNKAHSFTGKVQLLGGTVGVASLANSVTPTGSLGALRTKASDFVINGATLQTAGNELIAADPMTFGEEGATFNAVQNIELQGMLTGTGQLVKTGAGTLKLSREGSNSYSGGTVLKAGTLEAGKSDVTFGKVGSPLTLMGGTLQVHDNNDVYNIPELNHAVVVPVGATATLRGGSRSEIKGSFSGGGTLNLYIPYVRTEVSANWKDYTGKLNVTGSLFRLGGGLDFSNATLTLGEGLKVGHYVKFSDPQRSGTTKFGSLATTFESVTLESGIYNVGYSNTNAIFAGSLNGVTVNKYGTANWTLTGPNNSCTLNIYGGRILANTSSGVANSGVTYVRSGGTLAGSGSVKNVTVFEGGTLEPASGTILVGRFTVDGDLNLNRGKLFIKRRSTRNDLVTVTGDVKMTNAVIEVEASNALAAGNELAIIKATGSITGTFSVTPAQPGENLKWDTSTLLEDGVLRVADATGLQSIGADGPKIYPTAVTDLCYIDVRDACQGTVTLELYTTEGQALLVRTFEASEMQTVEMSDYPSGVYLLILKAGDEELKQKITKK